VAIRSAPSRGVCQDAHHSPESRMRCDGIPARSVSDAACHPAPGHNPGPCDTLDPVKGLRRRASAVEVHSVPPWHGRARKTKPFSGLKLLWRASRKPPRPFTSLPTRARFSGPPPSRAAGHPRTVQAACLTW
jgi:hypothetical protein